MKAIIFDLDGTLVDSMKYWRSVSRNFMKTKGIDIEDAVQHKMTTMNLDASLKHLKDYYKLEESFEELMRDFSRTVEDFYRNKVETKEGCLEILKYFNRTLKQTIIVITHDESIALEAERVITIVDGKVVGDERNE